VAYRSNYCSDRLCYSENTSSPEAELDCYAGSQEESSGSQESLSTVNISELVQVWN